MAYYFTEPSHTFGEYLLVPGYSSTECIPQNVNLKTPLAKFRRGEEPRLSMNIPLTSAIMQAVSGVAMAIALAREGGISFIYGSQSCEAEAEMVRIIFRLYSTGDYSSRKIERILYEKGYRGRNGTRIHHNTITGIIQNPKYKGCYCGNKVRIVDHRTREQRFLPEEEWVVYKDETGETVPAIVSEELWEKCNQIFRERSDAIKSREHSFKDKSVFTGKI